MPGCRFCAAVVESGSRPLLAQPQMIESKRPDAWYDSGVRLNFAGLARPFSFTDGDNNMRNRFLVAVVLAAGLTVAGCAGFEHQSSLTSPSSSGLSGLLGSWTSGSIIPSPTSCTDFKWNISENTGTSAKGSFSAACAGSLTFTGTAEGSLSSSGTISWTAAAVASGPGISSCNISLMGTAQIQTDAIIIPYAGDTCLGKVSGTETLKRR